MSTNAGYLDHVLSNQAARAPEPENVHYWAARYVFVPFVDREFTLDQQSLLGLPELKAGIILPVTKFLQQIVDNEAVMKVPVGYDGVFKPVGPGIEQFRLVDRPPSVVFDALIRIFNPNMGVDPQQDNGLREVTTLRGGEDFNLLRDIQQTCLPERYDKVRPQLVQLATVVLDRPSIARPDTVEDIMALRAMVQGARARSIHQQVAKELYEATHVSFVWARWQYHNLQSQLENRERTHKERLSPLDAAVCDWLEVPYPRYQSNLVGAAPQTVIVQQQAAPAPTAAISAVSTIWCPSCGALTNLGPEGQKPQRCPSCKEPFEKAEAKAEEVVIPPAPANVKQQQPSKGR